MSKVPELDLHDDEILELEDIVETSDAGDDFSADASDLDLSFEQELEDLFSNSSDENATQAPPSAQAASIAADEFEGLEFESGDTIDLSGFELGETDAAAGGDEIMDLVEPLETAHFDMDGDDDLAATTVLSSRDQNQDLDDLDDLDFGSGEDETSENLAATTVMSVMPGQNERLADVGDFDLEAEDELTLDLGEDDENEDQADAFVEDEDFDISGLDELLGSDEAAADDIGPMASTADIDAAELGLEEIDLETTAVQDRETLPEPEEVESYTHTADLDVLGLEDLISDLELPDQESTGDDVPAGEFNIEDFVGGEDDMQFEDITEESTIDATDETGELIDLGLEDIVEKEKAPQQESGPDAEEPAMDFGEDLVDLSDTFDESLGGVEGLDDAMTMESAAEETASAEAGGEEWDIDLSSAELVPEPQPEPSFEEDEIEEAAVEETAEEETVAEAAALEEEWTYETRESVQPEEVSFEEPAPGEGATETAPEPAPVAAEAAPAPAMDQEAVEQLLATLEAMESRIHSLEAVVAERDALQSRVASLESELARVTESADSLEQSVRQAVDKLDTSLGESGAVAALVAQRLDDFRQSLEAREPARDEELANRVQQLKSALEQGRAEQTAKLDELAQKTERLNELDVLTEKVARTPSPNDMRIAATEAAQAVADETAHAVAKEAAQAAAGEKLQLALAEDGEVSRKLAEALSKATESLRQELAEQIAGVKKTVEEAAASQADEGERAEAVRASVREELDKALGEGGDAGTALRETVTTAVEGLRQELAEQIEGVKKTAEEAAASQVDEGERAEAVRASVREELDKALAEGGAVASKIEERIGAVEESARLDNMALESRLSQVIDRFGDPDTVPEPVINAISSGIVEAMDEGGPFHSRLEERIAEVARERQRDLESFASKVDEVLKTFREEGVSRTELDSLVGEKLAGLEESLRGAMLTAEDVAGIVDERTTPAVEQVRGELAGDLFSEVKDKVIEYVEQGVAKESERLDALVDSRMKELGEQVRPSTESMHAAASDALDQALPQFRASLVEELASHTASQPLDENTQNAITEAVETRMRDSLSEDSDIYESLVGNLTEQLERVIREGVESLERKTVSHEDWNVMAARLRQELTARIESEAAKSAARIIREEISNLLGED
ncbi:hypothetical protein DPQ33_07720 [Oceanidesulfovibrio indonesiensis]|uniref:Uncharacterized protein n=1 Tax=Oceanidesulfovibrio indonesiensis TaxID=54767 RepID=A0A7M3MGL1_9BACT|nr:hypothetical protein [Oceanidesulfovibrio indonesiensis]TVM17987.1 hypothetical protein DPQ33_07720 [Oceanidesulfovibrio indonesiensis]